MKKELQDLFDGLNKLCSETEAFYFSEQEYGGFDLNANK